jgi:ABC-type multidrug transport system fused ATPase/permease subunit
VSPVRALTTIWRVLTFAQRRRFVELQFLSLLMAMSTVAGLTAVMTFLAVLADPAFIENHAPLNWLWRFLGMTKPDFLVALSGGFIGLLLLSAVVNVFGSLVMGRFAQDVGDRIREVLFAEYLRRGYLFHAHVGAGRLMDNVLNQADRVTLTLLHGQLLITNAVLMLLVVGSIAMVNITVATVGVLAVAGGYSLFYALIRRRVGSQGQLQTRLSAERVAVVEQAFLGIKYLLISRAQQFFSTRLAAVTRPLSHSFAETRFIGQVPKYILECVAGAALIACAAIVSSGSSGGVWLAQLSFIAFAGFRLLPACQQMYQAFVILRSNRWAIESLASELAGTSLAQDVEEKCSGVTGLLQSIELFGVSFRYSPGTPLVIDNASLRIAAGAAIGIVGASGCGKTTLVDLILGLLAPAGGRIEVDGLVLDPGRVAGWQQSIGYVPQDVLIMETSLRENIAFGIHAGEIDDDRVRDAARLAGASEFIEALPDGYHSRVSGVGGSLSGGQRQRVGIARALYRRPSLLVFDEATSSLDADIERAIVDAVVRNRGTRTLLIVTHGAALIDACDRVFELQNGTLHDRGSPWASGQAPGSARDKQRARA